jgi:hypothetical protein
VGNGQRQEAFWNRISTHYNLNRPSGCGECPTRSLETKWDTIKHDVSKFIGVYNQVVACRESGTSADDVLQNALELYKVKHPKQLCFVFIHCWLILKDIPRWMETPAETRQCAVVRTSPLIAARSRAAPTGERTKQGPSNLGFDEEGDGGDVDASDLGIPSSGKRSRPSG